MEAGLGFGRMVHYPDKREDAAEVLPSSANRLLKRGLHVWTLSSCVCQFAVRMMIGKAKAMIRHLSDE